MGKRLWVIGLGLLFLGIAALALSPRWKCQEIVMFEVVSCPDEVGKREFLAAFEAALSRLDYARTAGDDTDGNRYAHRSGDREFRVAGSGNDVLVSYTTRAEVRLWGLVDGRRSWLRDVDTISRALPLLRVQEENAPPGE